MAIPSRLGVVRMLRRIGLVCLAFFGVLACTASASPRNWAAPEIEAVTKAGVLGTSPATFAPTSPLTQRALEAAVKTTDAIQHPPAPPAPPPTPLTLTSTVGPAAVIGGSVAVEIGVTGRDVARISFAVDTVQQPTATAAPYTLELDTTKLPDGPHTLVANVAFAGGGYAIAMWQVTVANAAGSVSTPTGTPVTLTIAKSWLPAPPATAPAPAPTVVPSLYRAA